MKKTIVAIALAVLTVFAIAVPAMAATGETTVGIEVTASAPVTVSCEVPLKLAFSVAGDTNTVTVPKEAYTIKNNSGAGTAIDVTKIQVQGISGAKWSLLNTVPTVTGATDKYKMQLKIEKTALPTLPAGATSLADMASVPAALKNIVDGTMVPMELAAVVGGAPNTAYKEAEALADQFKIIYTVAKKA
ncbi:MAG: hypothetical protein RR292_06180 [Christensenellaceae bacterium]